MYASRSYSVIDFSFYGVSGWKLKVGDVSIFQMSSSYSLCQGCGFVELVHFDDSDRKHRYRLSEEFLHFSLGFIIESLLRMRIDLLRSICRRSSITKRIVPLSIVVLLCVSSYTSPVIATKPSQDITLNNIYIFPPYFHLQLGFR